MRDILLIAPYKQHDEWGSNAKGFVNLLVNNYQKGKISLRPVWYNSSNITSTDRTYAVYEKNTVDDPSNTILIQYGLPSTFVYNGSFAKNIGIFHVDCNIKHMDWIDNVNLLDCVVVMSNEEAEILKESGIEKDKIFAFDFPPIYLNHTKQDLNLRFSGTKFYSVGGSDIHDGTYDLLYAYLSEFDITSDTTLVLATEEQNAMYTIIQDIKGELGIFANADYYPQIAIIGSTEEHVINYLHENCDIYVDTRYNFRPTQNMLRASMFSKKMVIPQLENGVFGYNPYYYSTIHNISHTGSRHIRHMYDGRTFISGPYTHSLKQAMRLAYDDTNNNIDADDYAKTLSKFNRSISTASIKKMRGLLENV